jgi:triphosphoribosyl-dephospho-CoA synthase
MDIRNQKQIAQLAQMACILEACAPKPGNVNRAHDFADTSLEDFLLSAAAIGPAFENAAQTGVGETIFHATVATRQWAKTNTNLGLILLLAPLVKSCAATAEIEPSLKIDLKNIRQRLNATLNSLTVEDAKRAYAAIRLAQPGGLGRVSHADVTSEPEITLLQAMDLAQDRDSVAREYATGYAITFETGLPALKMALRRDGDFSKAIVHAFLAILKQVPDTLIVRKRGFDIARQVSEKAREVFDLGGVYTSEGQASLAEMDRALRDDAHTLNPGTTADLTAAAIFLVLIEKQEKTNDAFPGIR